ncbi:DNA-3-methyladenine glycosylase family protein [Paenibacillus sacheonensis]|uniref:DNA-3-methyladenine glycosylase II n=1 Tax=Paenibacillus sacheonensis TaxID=742054 RepID=A0A7X4YKW2_9BACL|nr:DNA-3-methyladenine glycosylase 2 family protein [Paenibacillus sacheonensis]MBM7563269.1 DNA-3-methyladenine glycosylase II [Paenibacillus sacheonensis]NBC68173.1 DNA-3-methyladenine glycosylase [Paenibacillus sacheonensis]
MSPNPITITMTPPKAFDFHHILGYLARSSNECLYRVDGETVTKLITVLGPPILIRVASLPDGSLSIALPSLTEPPDAALSAAISDYVRDWFDMDRDLEPFLALALQDPVLAEPVRQFNGLRIVGIAELFEAICWGIMGQQINLAFAYTLKRRFVERFGASVEWEGRRYFAFPEPDVIAALDQAELTRIRGIGPWTANYVLMRCLRMPAAFPIEDVGLHNALKLVLGRDTKPSIAEIKELSAEWKDWKAYATFYLWRLLY